MTTTAVETLVAEHRERLVAMAYRMLGQVTEAEDVVQETFLRWSQADTPAIDNPGGWLTTVGSRLCLDRLRSAAHRHETYIGPWLPEPIATEQLDLTEGAVMGESLTLAFLVLLESLSPLERVAFLLHDVFDYDHAEVAAMLERSPASARQLVSRARGHVAQRRPRFERDAKRRWEVAGAFLAAAQGDSLDELIALLAPDVVFTSDGGGVVSAARRPVEGANPVARFVLGLLRTAAEDMEVQPTEVNGMPAVLGVVDGRVDTVIVLDIADGRVTGIRAIRNPAKLTTITATVRTTAMSAASLPEPFRCHEVCLLDSRDEASRSRS